MWRSLPNRYGAALLRKLPSSTNNKKLAAQGDKQQSSEVQISKDQIPTYFLWRRLRVYTVSLARWKCLGTLHSSRLGLACGVLVLPLLRRERCHLARVTQLACPMYESAAQL